MKTKTIELLPLTQAQKRIWYTELLYPNTTACILSGTIKMQNQIDIDVLQQSFQSVIKENDSFRIKLTFENGEAKQYVEPYTYKEIKYIDFSETSMRDDVENWLDSHNRTSMELYNSELYEIMIFKINDEEYGYNIKIHHIICDGIFLAQIIEDVNQNYADMIKGAFFDTYKKHSYLDYIQAEEEYENSARFQKDRAFWLEKFQSLPDFTELKPYNPLLTSTAAERTYLEVSVDFYHKVRAFCKENKISMFTFFLGALYIYINKVTNEKNLIIGTNYANRTTRQEKETMGMFTSTVAVKVSLDPEDDIISFLQQVSKEQTKILRHQKYPYNQLIKDVRQIHSMPDLGRLFGITMEYRPFRNMVDMDGTKIDIKSSFCGNEVNDLLVHVVEKIDEGYLEIYADYRTCLFDEKHIDVLFRHVFAIAEHIMNHPFEKIAEVSLISEYETKQLLNEFNNTSSEYPHEKTVYQLFEEQVERTPDHLAVVFEDQQLTYCELNERANQLARTLRKEGVQADRLVGIIAKHSLEMVVGILAVSKAGGAYVPIDPQYPEERIQYMLEDSKARIVLVNGDVHPPLSYDGVIISLSESQSYDKQTTNLEPISHGKDLAYVIYTSGSTGNPKGVLIEHQGLTNYIWWAREVYVQGEKTNFPLYSSISFDLTVTSVFTPLITGNTILVYDGEDKAALIPTIMQDSRVDIIKLTPAHLHILKEMNLAEYTTVQKMIVGGENLSAKLARDVSEQSDGRISIYNEYGPTETVVGCMIYRYDPAEDRREYVPIGKPAANTSIYLLDPKLNLVPTGVQGELYIAGDGVARGYLNQPGLTAEKFVENPFIPGERMYKTGDLAKWLPDGNIEYIGRIDDQVKIRGFRMELGEIESVISTFPIIREVVLTVYEDEDHDKRLVAYIVPVLNQEISINELRSFMEKKLPDYMIPSVFIKLETLPLTINGKINRKALPKPTEAMHSGIEYTAPSTELEERLVNIWCKVLHVKSIGVKDNFFKIGGHSIKALTLIAYIKRDIGVEVTIQEIFQSPTIEAMSIIIENKELSSYHSIQPTEHKEYYPVSSSQKRLLILDQIEEAKGSYNMPGAMVIEGKLDKERFEQAFIKLIERHESLRTSFDWIEGEPVQKITEKIDFCIQFDSCEEEEIESKVAHFIKPFDLKKAPLLRVQLLHVSPTRHIFLFDMHHIISDGVSMKIFIRELQALYEGKKLAKLDIQYKDYAVWQNEQYQNGNLKNMETYWLEKFSDELPVLELPTDYPRSSVKSYRGSHLSFVVDKELTEGLRNISKQTESTLYMVLLAAYATLLSKYTGQEDIIIGSPVAGREQVELNDIMGMFVNTVAMRTYPEGHKTFLDLVKELKGESLKVFENQGYPFEKVVEKLGIKRDLSRHPLFDTMLVLQNPENIELKELADLKIKPYEFENQSSKFDLTLNIEENAQGLLVGIEYCLDLYKRETITRMSKNFIQLLQTIVNNPMQCVSNIEIITQEEIKILKEFNNTKVDYPTDKMIHQLFEEQVERTPDHVAVVFEDQQLTYRELNERANQLARVLREKGITKEKIVGILVKPSLEMIIGVLGVLKAGGSYLPIDPAYPSDRIQYMLTDSQARWLLKQEELEAPVGYVGEVITLDQEELYQREGTNLTHINQLHDLAYVIYTSGSTGKPKGVLLEHGSFLNMCHWNMDYYQLTEKDRMTKYAGFGFDASVWEIFPCLVAGATLYVVPEEIRFDVEKLNSYFEQNQITISFLPTQMCEQFLPFANQSLRILQTAGDKLIQATKHPLSQYKLVNNYGPTENTVVTTAYKIEKQVINIPIGKPIANSKIYIVDRCGNLAPIGIAGELCITGESLARGYLNQPELTAEKFVDNPFESGTKMYKTGDVAKWLPDGNIVFMGRIDHQVKIRGYRIELGEVESALQKVELVRESIVVARENEGGVKRLCAYFVGDESLTVRQLREAMSQELPEYMIPSYFVQLAHMPLTPNGKIDRKALPAPEGNLQTGTEYVAPQTPIEEMLVSIWQTVLGVPQIGVLDNFFDLGGDSIKSIQVSSRLHQAGYRVDMKNLFKYSTVASLSPHVEKITRVAEQGEVTGEAKLTPIQRWFFDRKVTAPHHFNQAFMLYRNQGFDVLALRKTMRKIAEHHDALRMVFRQTEQGYEAWNRGIGEEELFSLEVMDFTGNANPTLAIEEAANGIQSSIDLSEGPLIKLGLFQCAEGDHLLIVIHHLVVDGVSWRILLEDIGAGYEQVVNEEAIQLPQKTDSFQLWAEQLSLYANRPDMEKEREYWNEIEQIPTGLLPKDEEQDCGLIKDSEDITVQWTASETEQLLKQANRAYNTEINDLLLTALGMAIHQWTGMENIVVNLEGHGRESILSDLDITRTVGWFTSQYPVVLPIEAGSDISHRIKDIKEGLRQIPNKGIGYGLLKYLSENQEKQAFTLNPEISFNYLGQFDQDLENSAMQISSYSSGLSANTNQLRVFVLDINSMILDGKMSLTINYNRKQYRRETIEQLANGLQSSLQEVIEHCITKERAELTPSDIIFKGMTIEALDRVVQETQHIGEIENVYPLTPMQKGMLFHSLLNSQSEAYFEQARFDIQGNMNIESFAQSLEQLVQRHAIFRTNFMSTWNDEPLQVVYRNRKIDFHYEDLHEIEEPSREEWIKVYMSEDRERGFNLAEDALMRMTILRTEEQTYRVIWSFHHILMDGWCIPLVTQEIFETYYAIQEQREPKLSVVTPYSNYIEWLEAQNHEESSKYWNDYLDGYEGQTLLPKVTSSRENENYISGNLVWNLGKELTDQLKKVANSNQVTLNTLMQTAWGVLLQRYNNSTDVVFGSVVSGRPSEILGVENIIGLFINTIPVRICCDAEDSFVEVMKRNQKQAVASHAYDTHPLYEIQAQTEQKQDLITHIMVFENYPLEQQMEHSENHSETDLIIENVSMTEQTNYDFNVIVIPDEEVKMHFEYNANVYDYASVTRIKDHLIQIMEQVVNDVQLCVHELELVTVEEKMQVLEVFNDTAVEYPHEKTVYQLFEEQVERTPDHLAVVFEDQQFTYRELNERANQLARTLRKEGVQADQLVGIIAKHSLEMVVGILAVSKAGGAYVPIDPQYPEERIQYVLENSKARVVLVHGDVHPPLSYDGVIISLSESQSYDKQKTNLEPISHGKDLAYVIYTSGSTGNPKGVLIEHQGLTNYIWWAREVYVQGEKTNFPLYSSISFDLTVTSVFTPLITGNTILVYDGEDKAALIPTIMQDSRVDIIKLTPAHLHILKEMNLAEYTTVQKMIVGGENLSAKLARDVSEQSDGRISIYNEYGPTETVVGCMIYRYDPAEDRREYVPIGKPAANTSIYLLDPKLNLAPTGVQGELYIAGDGVARGYLNQPGLITAEKFVENPFIPGERMYKTGDLAKWLPDGNIEYIGRIDDQVKIRGYRIELGEVESVLQKVDLVREAIVVARESKDGLKQLYAYFVGDESLTVGQLREAMLQELPEYMIPAYFVQLVQMPLTPNGKVDRKALPEPEGNLQTGIEYVAPRTRIEEQLMEIWKEVLFNEHIGVKDNFFDVGGHSLRATTLVSKIHKQMNINVTLRDVFRYQTVEQMAEFITGIEEKTYLSIPVTPGRTYYPVSSTQKRMYILSQLEGGELSYNMPGVMIVEGELDSARVEEAFQKLIQRHESLRTSFEMIQGEPVQHISSEVMFSIEKIQAEKEGIDTHIDRFVRPFNLQEAPLLRVGLIEMRKDYHVLLFDIHHIISDGVSTNLIIKEFVQLYEGESQLPLRIQYKDYAAWQQNEMQSERMKKQEAYWLNMFDGEIPELELPIDYERPSVRSYEGDVVEFTIDKQISDGLTEIGKQTGATLYMVLLAAYTTLLSKYSGQEDIIVGTPIAGRTHADLDPIIGMFVNTLAIRNYPAGDKTFYTYVQEVKETMLNAYENQNYPFEELVQKVNIKRDMSRNPLFDTMFVLQNTEETELQIENLVFKPYIRDRKIAKFDLTLFVNLDGEQLKCSFEFCKKLFEKNRINELSKDFLIVLSEVVKNQNVQLRNVKLSEKAIKSESSIREIELNF